MEMFYPLLLTVHIIVGVTVIGLVLIQHGKGADMGAAFGSGGSGSQFSVADHGGSGCGVLFDQPRLDLSGERQAEIVG